MSKMIKTLHRKKYHRANGLLGVPNISVEMSQVTWFFTEMNEVTILLFLTIIQILH